MLSYNNAVPPSAQSSLPTALAPAPPFSHAIPPAPSALPFITINFSNSSSSPLTATAHAHSPTNHSLSPSQPTLSTPPSTTIHDSTQETKWAELTAHFAEARLRQHAWDWSSKDKDWLPIYKYQVVTNISDVWIEWAEGIGGFLPVHDLTEHWGARWR